MSRKRDRELENSLRREEAKRRRLERVIAGYINICHSEIYNEAWQFYKGLEEMYPDKKDLRKTPAFMSLKHMRNKPTEKVNFCRTRERTVTDKMVLQIPLMKTTTTNVRETSGPSPPSEETTVETTTTNVRETSGPPPSSEETTVETTTTNVRETSGPSPSSEETTVETTTELPLIDDGTLEELIAELREDSNLQGFFDNLDFEMDDCPQW